MGKTIHGYHGTPTYKTWTKLHQRCTNPHDREFHNYGGRGISVCTRWNDFSNFLADMGERPNGLTIDRIDHNGHYEPGNCRWADQHDQHRNRRITKMVEFVGVMVPLLDVTSYYGVDHDLVSTRLWQGWDIIEAIFLPRGRKGVQRHGHRRKSSTRAQSWTPEMREAARERAAQTWTPEMRAKARENALTNGGRPPRPIRAPSGVFESGQAAAQHYGITRQRVCQLAKRGTNGWSYV